MHIEAVNMAVTVQPGYENPNLYAKDMEAQQMAMTNQPTTYGMQAAASNIPPGLEYLATLDRVKIHQVLHLVEGKY